MSFSCVEPYCRPARRNGSEQAKTGGFTLVELAVVLVILALLLAGLLGPLGTRVEQKERQTTQAQLEEIREALIGFAVANGRLPCPDSAGNDGVEDSAGGPLPAPIECSAAEGNIPWQTLSVAQQDEWQRPFLYHVTTFPGAGAPAPPTGDFARQPNAVPCGTASATVTFELCSQGDITVLDGAGGATVVAQIPALVLSRGSNRNDAGSAIGGTLSAHEAENANGDNVFVNKVFSRDDANEFDDLVIWISPNVLKERMVLAGRLP